MKLYIVININYINHARKMDKIIIGFEFDENQKHISPIWRNIENININEQISLAKQRLDICKTCEHLKKEEKTNIFSCGLCHCGLMHKIKLIFPLDEEGKAFNNFNPYTKEKVPVCKLKKW